MAIGAGAYWVLSLTSITRKKLYTILITLLAALFWELLETLEDLLIPNPTYLQDIFLWDGVGDIIFTVLGGVCALALLYILKKFSPYAKEFA